jgi:uncharacterized protein YndB with AHSA1/START domain
MLVTILIILAVAILGLLVAASFKPDEFHVARSMAIQAPAERVFNLVDDLHAFQKWSPWAEADPHAHMVHEGAPRGEGAVLRWQGKKTGKGIMTITKSRPPEGVDMRLEFLKPLKATNEVTFTFAERDGATDVHWAMHGRNNFVAKMMMVFIDCEKMCGKQFEHGLRNLKAHAEAGNV